MSNQETLSRVLELISHLGGPNYAPDEIQWAADIPAGKRLLEWLASQLPDPTSSTNRVPGSNHNAGTIRNASDLIQITVAPIALYSEEVEILNALEVQGRVEGSNKGASVPAAYELPSQLRSRTDALESEANLLERQAARLKHRLNATKTATKDLKHTIHTLRKQIKDLDGSIQGQQQRLTDISVETDNALAQHVDVALCAVEDAVPAKASGDTDAFEGYRTDMASMSSSRASAASAIKQLYLSLDERYASLPTAPELQHDAAIVDAKLRDPAKDKTSSQLVLQMACVDELEKMTRKLEVGTAAPDAIADIVRLSAVASESKEAGMTITPSLKVDVKRELERAGRMDRLVLLRAQEQGLGTVIDYMREHLIPHLQQMYDDLHTRSVAAIETEAIVSALIEELEDINDDVENARSSSWSGALDEPENLLEAEMIELLKGLPDTHGNPAVLLNRDDVEREVSALSARLDASRKADEKSANQLHDRVRELTSSTAPLLSVVYANSPINTSPPFASSRNQVILQTNTRAKADELIDAAGRLQKDTELSSRDKRKLGSPGRFFAANELKAILPYIVINDDLKIAGDGERPTNLYFPTNVVPHPKVQIMFSKRNVTV